MSEDGNDNTEMEQDQKVTFPKTDPVPDDGAPLPKEQWTPAAGDDE